MDSHILIPKQTFKEFLKNYEFYYKYDVLHKKITKGFPKTTFTEKDYYSVGMEKKLNRYIETPLKELLNFCRNFTISKSENIIVDEPLLDIAWTYFKSLIARNPKMCKSVSEHSVFFQFLTSQEQHDITVDLTMANLEKQDFSQKLDISFLINETNIPFVLPTRGMYEHIINNVMCYAVPINPYVCLYFKEKGRLIHEKDDKNSYFLISKDMDEIVHQLNEFAFIKQNNDGIGYVVSSDKSILEDLKQRLI